MYAAPPKILSRSNTVDGPVHPFEGGDASNQQWQGHTNQVIQGQRSGRPAMFVAPMSPLNNGWDSQQQIMSQGKPV